MTDIQSIISDTSYMVASKGILTYLSSTTKQYHTTNLSYTVYDLVSELDSHVPDEKNFKVNFLGDDSVLVILGDIKCSEDTCQQIWNLILEASISNVDKSKIGFIVGHSFGRTRKSSVTPEIYEPKTRTDFQPACYSSISLPSKGFLSSKVKGMIAGMPLGISYGIFSGVSSIPETATTAAATSTTAAATSTTAAATSTTAAATSTTAAAITSTTFLSAKSAMASIVAVMLVTSGAYVAEPELFEIYPNIDSDGMSDLSTTPALSDPGGAVNRNAESGTSPHVPAVSSSPSSSIDPKISSASSDASSFTKQVSPVTADTLSPIPDIVTQDEIQAIAASVESASAGGAAIAVPDFAIPPTISIVGYEEHLEASRTISVDDDTGNVLRISADSILVYDSDGEMLFLVGGTGDRPGQFKNPEAVVSGSIVVADSGNHRIQKFDSNGNFLFEFGKYGTGPGELDKPGDVAINDEGHFLVADTFNHRIQKFDSNGQYLSGFGSHCSLVGDPINTCDDPDGDGPLEFGDGQFFNPTAIAIDKQGNIVVADSSNERIQIFDPDGNFLSKATVQTDGNILDGIMVDDDNSIIVLNDRQMMPSFRISFEDAVITFTEKFDDMMCDSNSMINDPIPVPSEIADALPVFDLTSKADALAVSGSYEEALLFYYIASQIELQNVHAWNGIGYSQTFLCDNSSAVDAYSNTLILDGTNVNALNGLGFFYSNHAQEQSRNSAPDDLVESTANLAIARYEKALEIDGSNVNALNGIGTVHIILKQYPNAIEFFVTSFGIDSDKISTLNGLAFAHLKSGHLVLAESFYEDTLDIDANNFDSLSGLLSIYLQQDKSDRANEMIANLAQFQQQVVQSLIEEAQWLLENGSAGDDDAAKRFLEKALQMDPGNVIAKDLLRNL